MASPAPSVYPKAFHLLIYVHALQPSDTKKLLAVSSKKAAVAETAAAAKDAKEASGQPEVVPADTQVCWGCHVPSQCMPQQPVGCLSDALAGMGCQPCCLGFLALVFG